MPPYGGGHNKTGREIAKRQNVRSPHLALRVTVRAKNDKLYKFRMMNFFCLFPFLVELMLFSNNERVIFIT